jgi:aminopeptidase N
MKVLFLSTAILLFHFAQSQSTQIPVIPGVSHTLADSRKTNLSSISYTLDFSIPVKRTEAIEGKEIIAVHIKNNSVPLQLDFKDSASKLHSLQVNGKTCAVNFTNEHIVISPSFLKKGKNHIRINFTAGELSLNRKEDYLYTLLVPDRARTFFPCFDQPDLKAFFTVTLKIPEGWTALTNGALKEEGTEWRFETSDLIPTYLFSIAAGKFSRQSQTVDGKKMNFLYRETDSAKIRMSVDAIFRTHKSALEFLRRYTGIKYPFKKFDFAAIPDFQYGGMEHVGAIYYNSSQLFLDSTATRNEELARTTVIFHETSHIWFGDLVTIKWFNDVWMKEVFANFIADKIMKDSSSKKDYELKFLTSHHPAAYSVDRTRGANPIRQPLENLNEAGTLYGNIIYHKAPIVMRQLEMLMGEGSFRKGLREYLQKYANSNATWPQLVTILDKYTPLNLVDWNRVWVNTPGRPVINYEVNYLGDKISKFTVRQNAESGGAETWAQIFDIAFVYGDSLVRTTVNLQGIEKRITELEGKPKPDLIVFNASGMGYGLFPVDEAVLDKPLSITDPVVRASMYINLYENMLSGKNIHPKQLLEWYATNMYKEEEELSLALLTGQVNEIFWRFLKPATRNALAPQLENDLWLALQKVNTANKKKLVFRSWMNIASTKNELDSLYRMWKEKIPPPGVRFAEQDYTGIAVNLVLKNYPDSNIINEQVARISNPDRKQRLAFMIPSLSADVATRDSFFTSLQNLQVRKNESRVEEALGYLHHPLRTGISLKYLPQTLEWLEEIQKTGDIFFPGAWLNASFRWYQDEKAVKIVNDFFSEHPAYNIKLKNKILQATDLLERAVKIAE